jgi:hypothetical protein
MFGNKAVGLGGLLEGRRLGFDMISRCIRQTGECYFPDVIFRGQANVLWNIAPTGFRDFPSGITNRERLRVWISEARRLGAPVARNYIEWLVLARHYGIATPLLDWTTNPLVALFFACSITGKEEDDEADGVIYYCHRSNFDEFWANDTIDVFKNRSRPALFDATGMNARSTAQDSLMTLHSANCQAVHGHKEMIRVPAAVKRHVLYSLPAFGIVDSRIFSDVSLAAQHFNNRTRLQDLLNAATAQDLHTMASEPAVDETSGATGEDAER